MDIRDFGTTGLKVSALGFGAGSIGGDEVSDGEAQRLIHRALDEGVTLFDTARSYGRSELRLGRALRGRREGVVLSTKVGYGVEGAADWSGEAVRRGIDEALVALGTDVIDVVHLHSCAPEVLARGEVMAALFQAREAGKIRLAGYAGDNEGLRDAVGRGAQAVIASANVFDQGFLNQGLGSAKDRGLGVIAKRPLGNAPWRFGERPEGRYCLPYWDRLRALGLDFGDRWAEVALRFVAYTWGVDSVIAGTSSEAHLVENARWVRLGPLPEEVSAQVRCAWRAADPGWRGET